MLIVDDDPSIVKLLGRVCAGDGHETALYSVPEQALQHVAEHPLDLLVTDLAMPSMDGITVMRKAQQLQPSLFTLIITGHAGAFPIEDVLIDGNADVMFKPFHMNELRARIALAERRKKVIDALEDERRALQTVSTEMIQGLQTELAELRGGR